MPHNISNTPALRTKRIQLIVLKTSPASKASCGDTTKTQTLNPMKTKFLYALMGSVALLHTACYKTYNFSCEPQYGQVNGQIKATSKAKAQKLCNKNCGHDHGAVELQ